MALKTNFTKLSYINIEINKKIQDNISLKKNLEHVQRPWVAKNKNISHAKLSFIGRPS